MLEKNASTNILGEYCCFVCPSAMFRSLSLILPHTASHTHKHRPTQPRTSPSNPATSISHTYTHTHTYVKFFTKLKPTLKERHCSDMIIVKCKIAETKICVVGKWIFY